MFKFPVVLMLLSTLVITEAEAGVLCRALTVNVGLIRLYGKDYVPNVEARQKIINVELPKFIRSRKVDIFSLQEFWRRSDRKALAAQFDPEEYYVLHYPTWRSPTLHYGNGLVTGIRKAAFHIKRTEIPAFHAFQASSGLEKWVFRKGFVMLEIQHKEDPEMGAILVGTHLQDINVNSDGDSLDLKAVQAQMSQAEQLAEVAGNRSQATGYPILLGGDLNSGRNFAVQTYLRLATLNYCDPFILLGSTDPLVTWDPKNPLIAGGPFKDTPPAQIDHWLFRDGRNVSVFPEKYEVVLNETHPGLGTPTQDHGAVIFDFHLEKRRYH